MGSKKHKKHKSERYKERFDENGLERHPGLKLILKVGSNSTPEHGSNSPYGFHQGVPSQTEGGYDVPSEKHKKSKKKKKKKDREKKHKHHHKEKRHHYHKHRSSAVPEDSSQEDVSPAEEDDSSLNLHDSILEYAGITTEQSQAGRPVTKPMVPLKIEEIQSPSSSPLKSITELQNPLISPGAASTPGTVSTPGSFSTFGPGSTPSQVFTPRPQEGPRTPSTPLSESGREPRSCVLKLKQSKSPLTKLLDHLLRCLEKRDPHQFFAWPVTDDIAPGYSAIIKKPMDFSAMRQKIEDNEYGTLQEFEEDFRLMCENAILYNHVETVYHKAARRLLHLGSKLLQPESLMRSLKPLSGYMRELTTKQLGFELPSCDSVDHEHQILDSADETASNGAEEPSLGLIEEEDKRRAMRLENNPKSNFEPYVDDLSPEDILAQVQNASRMVKKKLTVRQKSHNLGFLRQNKDGTTSLKILLDGDGQEGPEKVITLGAFTGKLKQGTGQLQGFREDRRNKAKIVKPLNYGPFSSFAPVFDSRFANLSKEETDLVLNTYGDETGAEYTESIMEFTENSPYASILTNRLLDFLTQGEHSKTIDIIYESERQRQEQNEIQGSFPDNATADEKEYKKYKNVKIDFNKLKSLKELGIETSFLEELQDGVKAFELQKKIEDQLSTNLSLIERLHSTQHDRLSQQLPPHLSQVLRAGMDELHLAHQISSNLVSISKQVPPAAITDAHAVRKALGMSNVGLPSMTPPRLIVPSILQEVACLPRTKNSCSSSDTTSVPMDIEETETHVNHTAHSSVDLESELREFLENGSAGLAGSHTDDNTIEQMLLD